MAGCKRCTLKRKKGKRKKKIKEKEKGGKNGEQYVFFVFFFSISPCAGFFICAVVIFRVYKENCI